MGARIPTQIYRTVITLKMSKYTKSFKNRAEETQKLINAIPDLWKLVVQMQLVAETPPPNIKPEMIQSYIEARVYEIDLQLITLGFQRDTNRKLLTDMVKAIEIHAEKEKESAEYQQRIAAKRLNLEDFTAGLGRGYPQNAQNTQNPRKKTLQNPQTRAF